MKLLNVGKIVNTFGIKGELKIVSRFGMANRVFKVNNKLRINNNEYLITNVRFHKNNWLIELNGIKDINYIEHLKGYDVFFFEDNLKLNDNEYLISELVGYEVFNVDKSVGNVTDYDDSLINPLIKVNNSFYIPIKGNFIIKVDKQRRVIKAQNLEGLML